MGLGAIGEGVPARGLAVASGKGLPPPSMEASPAIGDAAPGARASWVARRSPVTCVRSAGFTVMTSSRGCALERVNKKARNKLVAKAPSATDALVRFKQTSRSSRRRRLSKKGRVEFTATGLDSLAGVHFTCAALNMQWTMSPALDKRVRFHILARGWATRTYDRSRLLHFHLAVVGSPLCWLAGCLYQEYCALAIAPAVAIR